MSVAEIYAASPIKRHRATKAEVEKAMEGHVIGKAELVGLYQRQPK